MTDQIIDDGTLKRRAPSAFILYMNEAIASLRHDGCSDGTTITLEMRREFLEQWKNLADEERHRFQKMAKEEHGKRKALVPRKPKKRKMQNRISLNSIVEIVQKFSEVQRATVIEIGLAGILQLKCKFLNHCLCEWLVRYFDPTTCSLTVHGRILRLTESHVHDCLGINAQGDLVEVEKSDGFLKVCKDLRVKKREIKLKDLKDYLQKAKNTDHVFKRKFASYILGAFLCPTTKAAINESFIQKVSDVKAIGTVNWAKLTLNFSRKGINDQCLYGHVQPNGCLFLLVVFYLDHVSPIPQVIPCVRLVPLMVGLGDAEIKGILHRFDEIGGYDNPGVVVHFRLEEGRMVDVKTSGNECGVSDDSNRDVRGTNLTMDIVVGLLLRQNMLLERQLAYQMPSQMASQVGSQMPGQLHQLGEQVDQKMPSEVGSQKARQLHEPGEQVDLNLVDPNGELHTHFMGAETSTPNPFQAHEDIVGKLKADKYTSSLSSNISYEMPFEVERQVLKQVEPSHVDPIR